MSSPSAQNFTHNPCPQCNGTGQITGWDDCGREITETCSCRTEK